MPMWSLNTGLSGTPGQLGSRERYYRQTPPHRCHLSRDDLLLSDRIIPFSSSSPPPAVSHGGKHFGCGRTVDPILHTVMDADFNQNLRQNKELKFEDLHTSHGP